MLISCIQSWTKDIPLENILQSPLFGAVINAIDSADGFDAAVDCLITMVRETRDVDDTLDVIRRLLPHIIYLQPEIKAAADEEDIEKLKGIARLLSEAGENWVVLIAREPHSFKRLVESILEVCVRDWEKEAIGYTFRFWEDLKLWLVMDRYAEARALYLPIYSQLVDVMISHLQFPKPESGDETDLFEGDRDQEDRFRNYRHEMGNVLKDCCEVLGVTACLTKISKLMESWATNYAPLATPLRIPHWQELEAAIFALRALGQVVPSDEDTILPRLISLLLSIPEQEKVRYQAVMTLGRYTEWTAQHPDTLKPQLDFMITSFNHPSKEVIRGATHSFQYFCLDCAELLKDHFNDIHDLYVNQIIKLLPSAAADLTEGMAAILARQSVDTLYEKFKMCADPIMEKVLQLGRVATDEPTKLAIAGEQHNH
jgi:transportin-3